MSLKGLKKNYPFPKKKPKVPRNDHGWFYYVNKQALMPFMGPDVELILEIGSWMGKSTRWMLEKSPNAHIICVDTWLGAYEQHTEKWCLEQLPTLYDTFIANNWEYRDRITPIRATSEVGLNLIARHYGIQPDLIYIDGAHDFVSVYVDFNTALNLYPDAQIVGDDIQHEPLRKAVTQVAEKHNIGVLTNMMELDDRPGVKQGCWWVYRQKENSTLLINNEGTYKENKKDDE